MNRTKDYRIHQKHKRINRAYRILKNVWLWDNENIIKKRAKKYADNFKNCSCEMCRNPRHSAFCNKEEKLTIQERKALIENT